MIPNILTTLRLILIPVYAYTMVVLNMPLLALGIFLFAGLTDVVDGFIARKFNMITKIGKVYDPLVDKLMKITAILCLTYEEIIPSWVIWFIIFKEGTMIIGGIFLYIRNVVIQSDWYGKGATVTFYAVIFFVIVFPDMQLWFKTTLLVIMIGMLALAAFGYLAKILKAFEKNEKTKDISL